MPFYYTIKAKGDKMRTKKLHYVSGQLVDCRTFLHKGLHHYNKTNNAFIKKNDKKPTPSFAYSVFEGKTRVGGTYGRVNAGEGWLHVELLYVSEKYRGQDLGSNLMDLAEDLAQKHKCFGMTVETWRFQALDFYKKRGFELYGQLKDCPPGSELYMLKKVLKYTE